MKKGIHYLFGQKNKSERDLRETVAHLAKLGSEVVEIPPEPFLDSTYELSEFVRFAKDCGTELALCCGLPDNCDLASDNSAEREEGIRYIRRIIEMMRNADLHLMIGTTWTTWPASMQHVFPKEEREAILDRIAKSYREAIKPIGDYGIRSAIEPMNRFENYLINTSREGVDFCEMVDNDNLGLLLDVFHMSIEETSISDAIETAGKRLIHLHLAERNRSLPGTGGVNWDELFEALKKNGYKGYLDIESFIVPYGDIATSVALWRDLSNGSSEAELDAMLVHAYRFLEKMATKHELVE